MNFYLNLYSEGPSRLLCTLSIAGEFGYGYRMLSTAACYGSLG